MADALDGDDDSRPGGDFVALLTKSGVKIEGFASPSTLTARRSTPAQCRATPAGLGALPQAQGDVSFAKMGLISLLRS